MAAPPPDPLAQAWRELGVFLRRGPGALWLAGLAMLAAAGLVAGLGWPWRLALAAAGLVLAGALTPAVHRFVSSGPEGDRKLPRR